MNAKTPVPAGQIISLAPPAASDVRCPICDAPGYVAFFELDSIPYEAGGLLATREEALAVPSGPVRLAFCRSCGYVGNTLFDAGRLTYGEHFSFSLHYSPVYQQFITALADRLVKRYNLSGKSVLEIACGQGDFLRLLCDLGNNRGMGIDPSLKQQVIDHERSGRIRYIRYYFADKYADEVGDFVCCRHLLQAMPDPKAFVQMVRRAVGPRLDTAVYFEVPNGAYLFDNLLVWNIVYERCSWFTPQSMARLFEICGFDVLASEPCYQRGQYLGIEARPARDAVRDRQPESKNLDTLAETLSYFAANCLRITEIWRQRLESLTNTQQRVVVWGAGAAAISFLNRFRVSDQIPYVVDINSQLHGQYVPGTGQRVIAPEALLDYKPDLVIITNPTYEAEIRQQLAVLGVTCEFLSL
jgi:SAM-dependent methyltransferase